MAQDMQNKIEDELFLAAESGNLEKFKQMFENPDLRKYINIEENGYQTLKAAAKNCNEKFLDYIVTIPEVTDEVMKKIISFTFARSCGRGELDIVKFYFKNEKYNKHLDLNYHSTLCFRMAYSNKMNDILQFLIIDANMSKNSDIVTEMNRGQGDEEFVNRMFEKRDMKNELTRDLSSSENKPRKVKV